MLEALEAALQFFIDLLLWIPLAIWELLLAALAALLNSIPVPQFLIDASANVTLVDPSVSWAASVLEVPTGVALVFTAYVLRFLIRRIPLVG